MKRPSFSASARLYLSALLLVAAAATCPAYTPPSPPPTYWDYFSDDFYTLSSRSANTAALTVNANGASQAVAGTTAFQQQYDILLNLEDSPATYRVRNRDSGLCIGAVNGGTSIGTAIGTINYTGAASQKWYLTGTGGGYWAFINVGAGLAMQTDAANPATVTLQAITYSTAQQWLANPAAPTDHYRKKGTAGYDDQYWRWGTDWAYNWGATGAGGSLWFAFCPMKWGPNWPGSGDLGGGYAALHSTSKPVYVLGYNEPDHTDQSNASTDTAIGQWPELQALNVPLVSPAAASTWGGWMGDFYNKINSHGYRVDYTAIHAYTSNLNVDTYLNNVNSVANTWGRKVWITEFQITNWGGYASWTEEAAYTFLAEFMWRAEDTPNLKRYSMYLWPGDPTANPWDVVGTNSYTHALYADGWTLTTIGELYAAWDADRTLETRSPYMIQGFQSMHRLSDISPAANPTYLTAVNLRVSDVQTQWVLVPSPTNGQYYIISLRDGRRLYTNGTTITFAPAGTTGTGVQWQVTPPDYRGYYFINNVATNTTLYSHRDNDGNGAPTAVYYGVVASGNATDYTRFRLIKPFAPVAVPAVPTVPANVAAAAGDHSVSLSWTGNGSSYTVYRTTTSGSGYVAIASSQVVTNYVDNTALNGLVYYYVVTAANLLGEASANSAQVSAAPLAGLTTPGLIADYKFEASDARDSSGRNFGGAVTGGVTYFSPGKVDGSAASFDGTSGYIQIPVVIANDFSIAFWMRSTATGGSGLQWYNGSGLVDGEVGGSVADFGTAMVGTKAAFGVGNPDTTIFSTSAVNDGAWHHVVATRNGTSGAMSLYVDGTLQATGTGPTGTRSAPSSLRIGGIQTGGGFFNGSLDEVRLYNYALSQTEVSRLAGTVVSSLVANYAFENNALDTSGLGNHGTATAGVSYVTGKVGAQAAQFDGSTGAVTIPFSLVNDFSIAAWVKTTATGGTGQWWSGAGIVDGEVNGAMSDFGLSLLGSKAGFGIGNVDTTIVSTSAINDGAWHHVAATRNNANGAMRLYVDGALQASGAGAIGSRTAPPALRIGGRQSGGNYLTGALDDVRLYNAVLTAGQVMALVNPSPAPWADTDVGFPGAEGYSSYVPATATWSVGGSGADIWLLSDQFHFLNTTQTGDGSLVTRVTALPTNADGTSTANAKAGLMFRASSTAYAAFVDVVYDVSQGLQFINRATLGAACTQTGPTVTGVTTPFWLRLTRGGNVFQASYSRTTGTPGPSDWVSLGNVTVTLPPTALAGLAVTSHSDGVLDSANFDSFRLNADSAPTIGAVPNQTIGENSSTAALPVVIGDLESPPANLVLTAQSSNLALTPISSIVLAGTGANRTVQITPASNLAGNAAITLSVNDGQITVNSVFNLAVQTTVAGGWRQQFFGTTANANAAADGADPDNDGLSNLWERAFGLNPTLSDAAGNLPTVGQSNGNLTLTYKRNLSATDLTYQVLWSGDLQYWSPIGVSDSPVSSDGVTEVRMGQAPMSLASPMYLRLKVTVAP